VTKPETTDADERRTALDQFAQGDDSQQQLVPIAPQGMVAQVFGAQQVAVKRDERQVLNRIRALAAAASGEWFYRFPVKNRKKGSTDYIEGPSIKMANDLARLYGNCDVDCRAVDLGTHIQFNARFIDLETGYSLTRPFQQRKGASQMGGDADRQADITFQIGASKAIRNVIVNALQTYADFALEEAKGALVEKIGGNVDAYRNRIIQRATERRIALNRIEAVVGRPSKEWIATDIARVMAIMRAIGDNMATVDESFPPLGEEEAKPAAASAELDQFASAGRPGQGSGLAPTAEQAGADNPTPSASASATPDLRIEAAEKIIALVSHTEKEPQQLLEELDALEPMLNERLAAYPEFVATALSIAAGVANKASSPDEALKYLKGLVR
jgi:hypothetical protein